MATPGDANAVATVVDGYALARKGQAGKALAIAAIGSFVAAILSLILLMLIAARSRRSPCASAPPRCWRS
ncbi:tripartite tricarboxylate transporter permease [Georgenia sp. SUBG003]|uniref:tripartite tricarboxylate transporter permease n=1 Tax=Georgenia sp. SUBG003 TaxID=1497974 RepID=UPI003AB161FE